MVDGARYTYHYWDEGLAILFWHDFTSGGEGCSGSGSTEDPVYRLECDVESADGESFSWQVQTQDGMTAEMWIDGQSIDLSKGTMFLVSTGEGGVQVEQLQRDFSELEPSYEAISALASSDPDVASFIASIDSKSDSADDGSEDGMAALVDALQLAGHSVEISSPIEQPFFFVTGQIVVVDGEEVQVFEYPDSAAAAADAALISPDASSVGTSIMNWMRTPHFYSKDRLIALYVGENDSITAALADVLGEPIAEGLTAAPPSQDESSTGSAPIDEDLLVTLPEVLINKRYDALPKIIGNPFGIGDLRSHTRVLNPADVIEELQSNLLLDTTKLIFTTDRSEFPDVSDYDPDDFWGNEEDVELIYSQGWGVDGQGEAILIIGLLPDGTQFWRAMIYSSQGFSADSTAAGAGSEAEASGTMHPLAGLVYRDGHEIWILDKNGEPVFVFDEPKIRLSADGRYALFQPEYDPDIWLADLTTGERRNLTESSNRYNGLPQWWPGQPDVIIFGSSDDLGPGFGYPTVVRTDGSGYQVLDQERVGPLALSPDGEQLAYGGFDHSGRIARRGSEPEDFYPSDYGLDVDKVFHPAWSPDGQKLAWEVSGDSEKHGWTSGVAVFDLGNKDAALFHTYTAVGGGSVPHHLSWSPNGHWLAFVTFNERAEDGRRPNLWIAHPDGGGEIRLGTAFESVWSPDGHQIAYSLFDESQEAYQVWIHDTLTGEQTQILPVGAAAVDWLEPTDELMQTIRQYSMTQ
jgi:Tol biopolymer transport system component